MSRFFLLAPNPCPAHRFHNLGESLIYLKTNNLLNDSFDIMMSRLILSIFLILAPVLVSQNALASLLPCEKMVKTQELSIHTQHKRSTASQEFTDASVNCSCGQSDCHISNKIGSATLFESIDYSTFFTYQEIYQSLKPIPQLGLTSPPFRPPIIA